MKLRLMVLLLSISLIGQLYGQSKTFITYEVQSNISGKLSKEAVLEIDKLQQKTIYYERNPKNKLSQASLVYTDYKTKVLKATEKMMLQSQLYMVKEDLVTPKWELLEGETKEISGFVCFKAKTSFRGRDYLAWYTKDMPLPYGPWKLQGLPGLIVKVYDTTKTFQWKLISVDQQSAPSIAFQGAKELWLKDYILKRDKFYKEKALEIRKRFLATAEEGVVIASLELPINKRQGKELVFEWEE